MVLTIFGPPALFQSSEHIPKQNKKTPYVGRYICKVLVDIDLRICLPAGPLFGGVIKEKTFGMIFALEKNKKIFQKVLDT